MRRHRSVTVAVAALTVLSATAVGRSPLPVRAAGTGVGDVPQGTQTDAAFAASGSAVSWSVATEQTSCYRPEVPFSGALGYDGYSGETACPGATTGEDTGATPSATQAGSNPGYPAATPMLAKDHSESDVEVDPTNPLHLIGSSKWFVSAEGYNHLLGFYESFDGGHTWPVQGHIPGYEGWTDNTDPVGAFDPWGNYYEFILPYQFAYSSSGGHDIRINPQVEPNPTLPAEAVTVAVRPHGASTATQWTTQHAGHLDVVASYDSIGNEPDKQWMAIDDNPSSPHFGRVYLMWVDFHTATPVPLVSWADARRDGTHTDWSAPQKLPEGSMHPQGDTYLLPHVAADGTVYTTLTNFKPKQGYCCVSIVLDRSSDGGATWQGPSVVNGSVVPPGLTYNNTTFRTGIENTFGVGRVLVGGHYPLYASWEDFSAGVDNVLLSASFDGGTTWTAPFQVNDNAAPADEFQPNLATAPDGTVSLAFYDRRLACPAMGTAAAATAGLALDTVNPDWSGALPPYGAQNYCVNAAIQFYAADLSPMGHNLRLSPNTWDPQLNSPHPFGIDDPTGFIGDYFGNAVDAAQGVDVATFVSTADDDGGNGAFRQQQVVATIPLP